MTPSVHPVSLLLASLLLSACCSCPPTTTTAERPTAQSEQLLVQVVRLEHTQANSIERILQDTLRTGGRDSLRTAIHAEQNALVLSGTAAQIQKALELIAKLDTPSQR
jgi:type II secretory pathway component GspD/PulD (secretin)